MFPELALKLSTKFIPISSGVNELEKVPNFTHSFVTISYTCEINCVYFLDDNCLEYVQLKLVK